MDDKVIDALMKEFVDGVLHEVFGPILARRRRRRRDPHRSRFHRKRPRF
jgi:hypothetical protein